MTIVWHTPSMENALENKHAYILPPAYVVRREGNSFTLFVCPHLGGVPISHNALQHFPECHEAAGGVPGPPPGGGTWPGTPRGGTQTPPRGGTWTPPGGVPDWVLPPRGGTRTPPGGYLTGYPPSPGGEGGVPRYDNRRSTHYTAGGMPLVFTQEDFLVHILFLSFAFLDGYTALYSNTDAKKPSSLTIDYAFSSE